MRQVDLKNPQYKILVVMIIIGLVLAGAESFNFLDPIKRPIQSSTVPIQLTLYNLKLRTENAVRTLAEIGELRGKNLDLEEENAKLFAENAKLSLLEEENEALRNQLGAVSTKDQELIVAKVIGESPVVSKKLLLIDKGEIHGIKKGMVVVVGNIYFGEIYSVSPRTSSIQLVSDPENKIPAITDKKVKGIAVGQFSAEVELTNLVQGDKLNEGDIVYTTGEGGYPSGLVIGKIKEIKKVEKDLFQKGVVELLINPSSLSIVFVVAEK